MNEKDLLGYRTLQAGLPAHAAATASLTVPIFIAPWACLVTFVGAVWGAAITGANTNTKHVNVINKGSAGAGTTELGSRDFVSGTDAVANDLYTLYSSAAGVALAEGDVISAQIEKIGTGIDVPESLFQVKYQRNPAVA